MSDHMPETDRDWRTHRLRALVYKHRQSRVYIIGNGGSYANASHIACDLLAAGVRAYTHDPANLTRLANDFGWESAHALWLRGVGERGDMLIALSGSGTSRNILVAVEEAERLGMAVWREYGAEQGYDMQRAEEHQVWIGHDLRWHLDMMKRIDDGDMARDG